MKHHYILEFDELKINGKAMGLCKDPEKKCLLVIDSGASVNIIPPWANDKLK